MKHNLSEYLKDANNSRKQRNQTGMRKNKAHAYSISSVNYSTVGLYDM